MSVVGRVFAIVPAALLAAAALAAPSAPAAPVPSPGEEFARVRGDLSGKEVVYYWAGEVRGVVPGERARKLFRVEGYNVGRLERTKDGLRLITREVTFYEDPATGEILGRWTNPYTRREVEVVHVWNDPVNSEWPASFALPAEDFGPDRVFSLRVYLLYPSPLPKSRFPEFAQADDYQAAELFQFFVRKDELADPARTSVPARISWTRIGPWLPFMRMGDRPGQMVYHCAGYKLPGGYADLPAKVRAYVEARGPQFRSAPAAYSEPNETSWTYFRKRLDAAASPQAPASK